MRDAEGLKDFATNGSKLGRLLNVGRSPLVVRLRGVLLKARCHYREHHWLCGGEQCPLCKCGSPVRVQWFGWFERLDGIQGLVRISNTQWTQHFAACRVGDVFGVYHEAGKGLCWRSMPDKFKLCPATPDITIRREVLSLHGIEFENLAAAPEAQIVGAICSKAREAIA